MADDLAEHVIKDGADHAVEARAAFAYPDRLPFVLHDFTRVAWTSAAAQAIWAPRLARIAAAWHDIQWRSVAAGVRQCALVRLSEAALLAAGPQWFAHGLSVAPLGLEAGLPFQYGSTSTPYDPAAGAEAGAGAQALVRAVIGRPDAVDAMRAAWMRRDADAIGALLGYPACCRQFFDAVWVRGRCVDTTWAMALADGGPSSSSPNTVDVAASPDTLGANILLRWIGVRKVPHLPCSFACAATHTFAQRLDAVGRDAGYAQELAWVDEALSWPVEWSALHGIAEIKTPVLKVAARTDATAGRYVVRRAGAGYPREGASGVRFPYVTQNKPAAMSKMFRLGLDNPLPAASPWPSWYHEDNGFASAYRMDRLHAPLVALARDALDADADTADTADITNAVLDLGCGNGALLAKICRDRPAWTPFGIDLNAEVLAHAAILHPSHPGNFTLADLFDTAHVPAGHRYALAILMVGRLSDVPPAVAAGLLGWLRAHCRHLLLYAYPSAGRPAFQELVDRAGFVLAPGKAGYAGLVSTWLSAPPSIVG